jgi:hypothetical protein
VSERVATWRIVTEFAKARKDSDTLARSLDRLEASKERLDDSTVAGDQQVVKSTKTRSRTIADVLKQTHAARIENEKAAVAVDDLTEATDRETKARKRGVGSLVQSLLMRRKLNEAYAQNARYIKAYAAAERDLEKIELRRKSATLALTAAENRHAAALKKYGAESKQVAAALLSVERRTLDVTRAEQQHAVVLRRVSAESARAGGSSGGLGSRLRRLAGDFDSVSASGAAFGKMLGLLKFPALISGIGVLIGSISNLSAGLLSLIGPLSQVGGLAAALPAAFLGLASVFGTVLGGLNGIGAALKAHTQMQTAAAAASGKASKAMAAQKAAADRLKKAQDALNKAQKEQQKTEKELEKQRQRYADMSDAKAQAEDMRRAAALTAQQTLNDPNATEEQKAAAKKALEDAKKAEEAVAKARAKQRQKVKKAENKNEDAKDKVRSAEKGVKSAQAAQAKAAKDAAAGTTAAAKAADAYQQALAKLTPEGRRFVEVLIKAQGELKKVRDAAQRGLLPGLGDAILILLKLVPMISDAVETFGRIIGNTAKKGAKILTSGPFTQMFGRILKSNQKLLRLAGRALLNVMQALIFVTDAARPFTKWLAETVTGWTKFWKASAKAGDETNKAGKPIGKMAKFLEGTKKVLKILGGIFKNLFGTFKGIGKAGMDLGMDLLKSFRRITKGWSDWTNSVEGQNSLKEWFDAARPVLHQTGKLIGDLVKWFFDFGKKSGKSNGNLIKQIRTEMLPALEHLVEVLSGDFATQLVDALTQVVQLISDLSEGGSGGLTTFVTTVGDLVKALDWIIRNVPGANSAFALLLGTLGALSALRFAGAITGVSKLIKIAGKSRKAGLLSGLLGKAGPEGEAASFTKRLGLALRKGLGKIGKGISKVAGGIGRGIVKGISGAFKAIPSLFKGLGRALGSVGRFFGSMLKVVGGVVAKIGGLMLRLAGYVGRAMMIIGRAMLANPWMLLIVALIVVVVLVVKYWDQIKKYVMKAVHWILNFIKKHWDIIKYFLGPMGLLIDQVVKHWDKIKELFFKAVVKILGFIKKYWPGLKYLFTHPMEAVKSALGSLWDKIKGVFTKGWQAIKDSASRAGDGLAKIWDGIQQVFAKPIEWIINTVIGDWLIGNLNKVLDFLGVKGITAPHVTLTAAPATKMPSSGMGSAGGGALHMARGGMVPGQGNRDSVPAVLMPGEFVLRKDAVKAIGLSRLTQMNERRDKRRRGYNTGGLVSGAPAPGRAGHTGDGGFLGSIGSFVGNVASGGVNLLTNAGGKAIDLARTGAAKGFAQALKPIRALASSQYSGLIGDMTGGLTNWLADKMVAFVKGKQKASISAQLPPAQAGDYAVTNFRGYTLDNLTIRRLLAAEQILGQQFGLTQGSYSTSVDASAGTHAGGGVFDAYTPFTAEAVAALRKAGFAAWRRYPSQGPWKEHIHAVAIGDKTASPAAQAQVQEYLNGGDGLAGNSPDYEVRPRQDSRRRRYARGGFSNGVDALLTPGEFVFNADAARRIGHNRLDRMNRSGSSGARAAARYARGGSVAKARRQPHNRHRDDEFRAYARGGSVRNSTARMLGLSGGSGFNFGFGASSTRIPTRALPGVSPAGLAAMTVNAPHYATYDIDVHNPVPERASESVSKAVRRKTGSSGWSR